MQASVENMDNPRVFLDVDINGEEAGRLTIVLFADVAPRTAENFRCAGGGRAAQGGSARRSPPPVRSPLRLASRRQLCTGEAGAGKSGKPLHFKGSAFHRVVRACECV